MSEAYEDVAQEEPQVEENPLASLVDAALAKDYNKANDIFGQAISVKMSDVMDQERIRLSNAIYNGEEEDPEDEVEDEDVEDSEDVSDGDDNVEDSDAEGDADGDEESDEDTNEEEVEN